MLMTTPQETHLGIGSYSLAEAGRLTRVPIRNVRRWLSGYAFVSNGVRQEMPPLWTTQWAGLDHQRLELGFRDLVELRFVQAFVDAGLGLLAVRNYLQTARELLNETHPLSTQKFQTDGKTIFLESISRSGDVEILDLKSKQYVIHSAIERTFKDLDLGQDQVVRWRPYKGRSSIVIDPERSFGQPIVAAGGVPTVVIAQALQAEGSADRVSRLYEVPISAVRDAVRFEQTLQAAA